MLDIDLAMFKMVTQVNRYSIAIVRLTPVNRLISIKEVVYAR